MIFIVTFNDNFITEVNDLMNKLMIFK